MLQSGWQWTEFFSVFLSLYNSVKNNFAINFQNHILSNHIDKMTSPSVNEPESVESRDREDEESMMEEDPICSDL